VRKVSSTSNGSRASRAASNQLRAFFALCEKAEDGPRILPFQGVGAPEDSETLPALLRFDLSNTTGASSLRAAPGPTADGRGSLVTLRAAIAAIAVLRSLAATAAMGSPT